MNVRLSRMHFPVHALGPGRRIGIWLQGCTIRCAGCISVDTWPVSGTPITVNELLAVTAGWAAAADGATISGGEPFEQPEALAEVLEGLRAQLRCDADILVYTGYPWEGLPCDLQHIDALITDPFQLEQPQARWLRGSDNQRMHLLTPLGQARYQDRLRTAADDRLDLLFDSEGTAWLAGIPRRGDLERLRASLEAQGAHATTSEHRP